jgi:hypothetical protein
MKGIAATEPVKYGQPFTSKTCGIKNVPHLIENRYKAVTETVQYERSPEILVLRDL